ncbi:cupin domain-containing protein [Caulobacter sp. 602-1]|uniref:cupin domain-containing protein n=1 Tax=Caulobacter sp. 602-1 TaxID=2492472 RepID=UPI000F62CD4A|nr:cupin domain-containing protein [Caulobacter sp. 602-1]RRN63973.1 cupin domain-containing protein [Caulobacter sp. 602-1]
MSAAHQPGQDHFHFVRPEDVAWRQFAAFPPEARLAVLLGDPGQAGIYVIRVRLPAGARIAPHRHPEDRTYTVLSGIFYIGLGETFVTDKLQAFGPGSLVVLPGGQPHFHWARDGEYITQVTAMGPLGLDYVASEDDPRRRGGLR